MIGQFFGLYFTVQPDKFESCSFPVSPINLRDIIKYPTYLVFSVRTVSYGSSFFPVDLSASSRNHKSTEKLGPKLTAGPRTRLVREVFIMLNFVVRKAERALDHYQVLDDDFTTEW